MGWELTLALRGDLQAFLDADVKAGKQAVTTVIRRKTTKLKDDLRRAVRRAGLSDRLGKAIRGDTYPRRGYSLNAAGVVQSKAITKRESGITDLITVLDEGAVINARPGRFLAIPVSDRVKGRGVKGEPVSRPPSAFGPGRFVFKASRNSNGVLVFADSPEEVAYILVRQVRLRKRIDVRSAHHRVVATIEREIAQQWERNHQKAAAKFEVTP